MNYILVVRAQCISLTMQGHQTPHGHNSLSLVITKLVSKSAGVHLSVVYDLDTVRTMGSL